MSRFFKLSSVLFIKIFFLSFVFSQGSAIHQFDGVIDHVTSSVNSESAEIKWGVACYTFEELKEVSAEVSIRYNIKMDQERFEKGFSDKGWMVEEGISIESTQHTIEGLEDGVEYVFQIGIGNEDDFFWTESYSFETKSKWDLFELLVLIGSLALFLYGMKIMSDGLQQATGKRLRHILGSMTSNRFKGILTGLGITTLIQSSSVTAVMTVSFVNAGILTLMQAAGVIMGANIGTTITAWLIDIFGFKVDIGPYTLILLAIGVPLFFMNSSKLKSWASVIIGFSLLFLGLGFLKASVPEVGPDSGIVNFFVDINNIPYFSTVIAVLFGTLLTVIIQSSSATVALTMTLMVSGVIPFEIGAAMVLGENIGTTITAELAASVGNVHAKRAARIHSSFNIFGVIVALILFPFLLKIVAFLTENLFGGNPLTDTREFGSTGLALLHTTFNVVNTLVMVWFIPQLVKFATYTVKSKGKKDEQFVLEYIGEGMNRTPELSLEEVKKELARFGEITSRMSGFAQQLLVEDNRKMQRELYKRIQKYEEITDRVEMEIADYLNKIASKSFDEKLARRISGMNRVITNLERIGDIFYQISKLIEKRNEEKISFSGLQNQRLIELFELIDQAFIVMCDNLGKKAEDVTMAQALVVEEKINVKRDEIRGEYYNVMLMEGSPNRITGDLLYNNIYHLLERVGDHIINVTEGILGKVQ